MAMDGFIDTPKGQSWILKNPTYKCQHGAGKCQLKHYPDDIPISCEYENKEWCPFRVIEEAQEKLVL